MKLKTRWIACLVAGLMSLPGSDARATDLTAYYTWKPLKIGGGGYVVGMDYSKTGMMYCRTDVSGAYCWHGLWGNNSWSQVVTTQSMPTGYNDVGTYQGVTSIVGAPSNVVSVYMAYAGQIFRSWNYGSTWSATTFGALGITMSPNGPARRCGERLGIDPATDNNAYFCPENDSLCRCSTLNGTWTKITAVPKGTAGWGVTTVKFDPNSGTTSDGFTKVVYVTVMNKGVWRSADAGTTWTNIAILANGPGNATGANHSAVGPDGTYYVCCGMDQSTTSGIWKYSPTLNAWTNISPSTDTTDYQAIAVDPNNANSIVVQEQGGAAWTSTDQGSSWISHSWIRASTNITWLGAQKYLWLSIGAIQFDPTAAGAGKLWFSEGFGMWNTTNLTGTITWAEQSSGIEETCGNQVICPPGGQPNTAMLDIGSFYHSNPDAYNAQRRIPQFQASWDLDWCPANPNFLVGVHHDAFESHTPAIDSTGYSTDGGMTWKTFPAVTGTLVDSLSPTGTVQFGCIAVSATNPAHIVWAPARVSTTPPLYSVLPYYTTNTGTTFTQSTWPSGVTNTGFSSTFSSMKPLAADRVLADTFYFYHPTAGIYKSVDGGANWARVANNPYNGCFNSTLKAAPGVAGDLWFASGWHAGGLYHSTSGGQYWTLNPAVTKAYSVGFGIRKPGTPNYPTIFIAGIVNGVEGIFRSTDEGTTWDTICTNMPLGIFDTIDAMDGDKTTFGKVYICNSYSGFTYGATSGP